MAAHELNLTDKIELTEALVLPGKENTDYANQVNPLRKIPALQIDDGSVILDSTVICHYLDELHGKHQLIPASGVSIRYETFLRPEPQRWPVWIDEQWEKINNALNWFNKRDNASAMTMDSIALACALGYLDFRSPDYTWREQYPHLATWHSKASQQDAYKTTVPE